MELKVAPPRGEEPYEVREIPAPREMPVPREVPAPRETLPEREIPPPRRTQRPGPGREPLRREPAPLPPRARELPVSLEDVRERLAVSLEERAREQAPVSLEEMRAPTRPLPPAAPRRRPSLGLDDPRALRRAIVLREILGPPGGLERSERDG